MKHNLTAAQLANVTYQMDTDSADRLRGEAMVRAASLGPEAFRAARAAILAAYDAAIEAAYNASLGT